MFNRGAGTTNHGRFPTYALPHGGRPWPWIKHLIPWSMQTLEDGLASVPAELPAPPSAVLVVTAHWETPVFTVQGHLNPEANVPIVQLSILQSETPPRRATASASSSADRQR